MRYSHDPIASANRRRAHARCRLSARSHQRTIEPETNVHDASTDRAHDENESQAAKTCQQRCTDVDPPQPSMQRRPARTNPTDQLDAAENENHPASKEMQSERWRGRR